jgi:hypothetical protein
MQIPDVVRGESTGFAVAYDVLGSLMLPCTAVRMRWPSPGCSKG